jgi:peptidoglycan/xylan/chitin deacetylase (PgdA/CDA1 family)
LTLLVSVISALVALYLVWRVRYGTPPQQWPQVLCFHKVTERFCWEGTWTKPARFFATVDRFLERGYRFVGIDGYLGAIEAATEEQPETDAVNRDLLLTFDDGYVELYDIVLPGLEARGVPFHVFLVSDYTGRTNDWDLSLGRRPFRHLDRNQIEDMAARGVTFGSHGATHSDLTRMGPDEIREELVRSKTAIEEYTGAPVRTLSYPFGRYNASVEALVRETGYDAAFSLYPSHANTRFRRTAIRRNGVYVVDTAPIVEAKVSPGTFFWLEEMKCRAINGLAVLTPVLKRP